MAKIDVSKLVVDNYSTEEIIDFLSKQAKIVSAALSAALEGGNLAAAGCQTANILILSRILQLLDEKLNGKKEATVVQ